MKKSIRFQEGEKTSDDSKGPIRSKKKKKRRSEEILGDEGNVQEDLVSRMSKLSNQVGNLAALSPMIVDSRGLLHKSSPGLAPLDEDRQGGQLTELQQEIQRRRELSNEEAQRDKVDVKALIIPLKSKQDGPSSEIVPGNVWSAHYSKSKQKHFWKNDLTGEKTWKEPMSAHTNLESLYPTQLKCSNVVVTAKDIPRSSPPRNNAKPELTPPLYAEDNNSGDFYSHSADAEIPVEISSTVSSNYCFTDQSAPNDYSTEPHKFDEALGSLTQPGRLNPERRLIILRLLESAPPPMAFRNADGMKESTSSKGELLLALLRPTITPTSGRRSPRISKFSVYMAQELSDASHTAGTLSVPIEESSNMRSSLIDAQLALKSTINGNVRTALRSSLGSRLSSLQETIPTKAVETSILALLSHPMSGELIAINHDQAYESQVDVYSRTRTHENDNELKQTMPDSPLNPIDRTPDRYSSQTHQSLPSSFSPSLSSPLFAQQFPSFLIGSASHDAYSILVAHSQQQLLMSLDLEAGALLLVPLQIPLADFTKLEESGSRFTAQTRIPLPCICRADVNLNLSDQSHSQPDFKFDRHIVTKQGLHLNQAGVYRCTAIQRHKSKDRNVKFRFLLRGPDGKEGFICFNATYPADPQPFLRRIAAAKFL